MSGSLIYPFMQITDLQLQVESFVDSATGVELQGVQLPENEFGVRRFDLSDATPIWSEINFRVSLEVNSEVLAEVLPPSKSANDSARVIVSVRSSTTKVRQGFLLKRKGEDHWTADLDIRRSDFRGLITLTPLIVRAKSGHVGEGLASFEGAIVGTGPEVELAIDRSAPDPRGDFEYKYERFSESQLDWLRDRPTDVFYLDPRSRPRVHLNIQWPSLQTVLESKANRGPNAALKRLYAMVIGHDLWTQAMTIAVGSIRLDSEENPLVEGDPWRRELALLVGSKLFPELTEQERLKELQRQFADAHELAILVSKIGSIAHDLATTGKSLDFAAQQLATTSESSPHGGTVNG